MPDTLHDYLYLASQSPRRRELLTQLGVRYELLLADDAEDAEALEAVLPGETPDDYVQRVCALKAEAALRASHERFARAFRSYRRTACRPRSRHPPTRAL